MEFHELRIYAALIQSQNKNPLRMIAVIVTTAIIIMLNALYVGGNKPGLIGVSFIVQMMFILLITVTLRRYIIKMSIVIRIRSLIRENNRIGCH